MGAGRQPFAQQRRLPGRCYDDHHVGPIHALLCAVHRLHLHLQAFTAALGEFLAALLPAAEHPHPFDAADRADRLQLGAGLKTGPDHRHSGGVFFGHILGGHPAGGPGADLPQAARLHARQQSAGLIVVEHDDHLGRAGPAERGIGLVSEDSLSLVGRSHEVEEAARHADPVPGTVVHLALSGVGEGLVKHVDALVHGQQLGHFLVVQKQGHISLLAFLAPFTGALRPLFVPRHGRQPSIAPCIPSEYASKSGAPLLQLERAHELRYGANRQHRQ